MFLADDPEAVGGQVREQGRAARDSYRKGAGKPGGRSVGGGPLLRLQVLTPQDAAAQIAASIEGMPVTDVFCFERIGGLADDLVDRHVELVAQALPTALETSMREGSAGLS